MRFVFYTPKKPITQKIPFYGFPKTPNEIIIPPSFSSPEEDDKLLLEIIIVKITCLALLQITTQKHLAYIDTQKNSWRSSQTQKSLQVKISDPKKIGHANP